MMGDDGYSLPRHPYNGIGLSFLKRVGDRHASGTRDCWDWEQGVAQPLRRHLPIQARCPAVVIALKAAIEIYSCGSD